MSGASCGSMLNRKASEEVGSRLGRRGTLKLRRGARGWALAGTWGTLVVGCSALGSCWAVRLAAARSRGRTVEVMQAPTVLVLARALRKVGMGAVLAMLLCQEGCRRGRDARVDSWGVPMMARRARPRRERMASVELGSLMRSSPVPRTAKRLTRAAMV